MRFIRMLAVSALALAQLAHPAVAQPNTGPGPVSGQEATQPREVRAAAVFIAPSDVRQVQEALEREGFGVGPVTDTWGPAAIKAAAEFQRARNLVPTGTPTTELLAALGLHRVITGEVARATAASGAGETAEGPGTPLYVSPALVLLVQQALAQRGFDVGRADGDWDGRTAEAASAFERAQGLVPTGVLDDGLIAALDLTGALTAPRAGAGDVAKAVTGMGAPIHLGREAVRYLEQRLAREGFPVRDTGPAPGQALQAALLAFQRARGLDPTGTVTTATLGALGMGRWATSNPLGAR